MIFLSGVETASVTDLLNGTRLQSAPRGGRMTFRFLADLNNATNRFTVTLQLPGGDTPLDLVPVPGSNPSLGGVMDDRQVLQVSFVVPQGGHVSVALTETGAAIASWQVIFR